MKKILKSALLAAVAVAGMSLAACSDGAKDKAAEKKAVDTEVNADDSKEAADEMTVDTKANAKDVIDWDNLQAEHTIIDFNATWCGPCKMFAPVFEAAAEKYAGEIEFVSVDIDEYPEIATHFGVESIPMVVILNSNGDVLGESVGYMDTDEFEEFIQQHI